MTQPNDPSFELAKAAFIKAGSIHFGIALLIEVMGQLTIGMIDLGFMRISPGVLYFGPAVYFIFRKYLPLLYETRRRDRLEKKEREKEKFKQWMREHEAEKQSAKD